MLPTQGHGDSEPSDGGREGSFALGAPPGSALISGRAGLAGLVALLSLLTVLAYSNTFRSPFVFDDEPQIVTNPLLRSPEIFWTPWKVSTLDLPEDYEVGFRWRYLAYLSLALNYSAHGTDVFGYHLVNLAIHLASALTLLFGLRRALALPLLDRSRLRGIELPVAGLVAGLFALHPLQTQAVTYTIQRMASLAALFCLVSLWAHLRARSAGRPARRRLFALVSALALIAAMATKQNAFAFPLVLGLVDLTLFPRREGWRRRARWLAVPLACSALVGLLAVRLIGTRAQAASSPRLPAVIVAGAPQMSAWDYRRTQIPVLATYLRLTLLPYRQNLDYDYPISRSWGEPRLLASGALLLVLLASGLALVRAREDRDPGWRLVGLGVLWFFVAHSVESSGLELLDPIFEHRMYLPSVGLFLAAVVALGVGVPKPRFPLAASMLAVATLVLGAATWARNEVWRSELRLLQDVLAKSPNKVRALTGVGQRLLELRRPDEAERYFLRAHELEPDQVVALVELGIVSRVKGKPDRAEEYFRQAIAADPNHWVALINLGDLALARGERAAAAALFERAAEHEELSSIAERRLERLRGGNKAAAAATPLLERGTR